MASPLRIAVVGPESCGKTTLARSLAHAWGEPWVEEVARDWLEARGGVYDAHDLPTIAALQRAREDELAASARRFLFCDTNGLVIRVWSEVKYGVVDLRVTASERLHDYALHLLTAPDLPWEFDPLRESPNAREMLFDRYEAALRAADVPFAVITGQGDARLQGAQQALARLR